MSIEKECRREGRNAITEKLGPRCVAIIGVLRAAPDGLTAWEINRELREEGDAQRVQNYGVEDDGMSGDCGKQNTTLRRNYNDTL